MNDNAMQDTAATKTPWHLWVVGILGLLWISVGVADFVVAQTKNAAWMAGLTEDQRQFFQALPTWTVASWAIAVFGGLAGMLLILFRSKLAVPAFAASLLGFLATAFQNYGLSNAWEVMGVGAAIFTGVIFAVAIFSLAYAFKMAKVGVLR